MQTGSVGFHSAGKKENCRRLQNRSAGTNVPPSYDYRSEIKLGKLADEKPEDQVRSAAAISAPGKRLNRVILTMRVHINQSKVCPFALGFNGNDVLIAFTARFKLDDVAAVVPRALQFP